MTDTPNQPLADVVSGLLLTQKVVLEALIRTDAVSYHQAKDALDGVLTALEQNGGSAAAKYPAEELLRLIDEIHRPLGAGEKPKAVDWAAELSRPLPK